MIHQCDYWQLWQHKHGFRLEQQRGGAERQIQSQMGTVAELSTMDVMHREYHLRKAS